MSKGVTFSTKSEGNVSAITLLAVIAYCLMSLTLCFKRIVPLVKNEGGNFEKFGSILTFNQLYRKE
jgi:hypothetical protein